MKDILAIRFKGSVYLHKKGRNTDLFLGKFHNDIQPNAKEITAKNLIGHPSAVIDTIALYNGINLLASIPITTKSIVGAQEMAFETTFSPTDFNGDFTEGRLIASGIGAFSIVSNLVGNKSDSESLVVTWNIIIS